MDNDFSLFSVEELATMEREGWSVDLGPDGDAGDELIDLTDDDEADSTTALVTLSSEILRKKLRRRMYHRRSKPFPKIFKSDIRRTFSQMWVNVWNWQNPFDYNNFLHHFFSYDVIARFEYEPGTAEKMIKYFPFATEANSTYKSVQNFAYASSIMDDAATVMHGCQIKRSSKAKCTQVLMYVSACRTITYDLNLPKLILDNGEEGFNMPIDSKEIRQYRVPAKQVMKAEASGVLVFDIDECTHYITQAVYRGTSFNATPLLT